MSEILTIRQLIAFDRYPEEPLDKAMNMLRDKMFAMKDNYCVIEVEAFARTFAESHLKAQKEAIIELLKQKKVDINESTYNAIMNTYLNQVK